MSALKIAYAKSNKVLKFQNSKQIKADSFHIMKFLSNERPLLFPQTPKITIKPSIFTLYCHTKLFLSFLSHSKLLLF